jgi:hypothetical protein
VGIITDAGSSSREQGNFVVREAVSSLMAFWEAPFQPSAERGQQGLLEAKSPQLVAWVGSSRFEALLVSLFPACLAEVSFLVAQWRGGAVDMVEMGDCQSEGWTGCAGADAPTANPTDSVCRTHMQDTNQCKEQSSWLCSCMLRSLSFLQRAFRPPSHSDNNSSC